MNTTLWIMQSIVAVVFISIGSIKAFSPTKKLKKTFATSVPVTRSMGLLEILGAAGVILPVLLNIYPALTAVAAASLGIVMLGAVVFHLQRKEYKMLPLVSALLIRSVIIAVNRF